MPDGIKIQVRLEYALSPVELSFEEISLPEANKNGRVFYWVSVIVNILFFSFIV